MNRIFWCVYFSNGKITYTHHFVMSFCVWRSRDLVLALVLCILSWFDFWFLCRAKPNQQHGRQRTKTVAINPYISIKCKAAALYSTAVYGFCIWMTVAFWFCCFQYDNVYFLAFIASAHGCSQFLFHLDVSLHHFKLSTLRY